MKKLYRSKLAYVLAAALLLMLFAGCTAPAEAESASPGVAAASAAPEETAPPSPVEETPALETERVLPTRNFEVDDTDVVVPFTVEDLYDAETGRFAFAPLPWGMTPEEILAETGVSRLPVFGELDSEIWYVFVLEEMEIRFFPSFTAAGSASDGTLDHINLVLSRPPLTDNLEEKVDAMLTAFTEAFGESAYEEQAVEEPGSGSPYITQVYEWRASSDDGNLTNLLQLGVDTVEEIPVRVSLLIANITQG